MAYQISEYSGDELYCIKCTGDAVVGDEVRFERAVFTGSYRKPQFDGFVKITGKIIKDSYGKDKQQHTFTLELVDGSKQMIKGRNLYSNETYRKIWADESLRQKVADEKHARGDMARAERYNRKNNLTNSFVL